MDYDDEALKSILGTQTSPDPSADDEASLVKAVQDAPVRPEYDQFLQHEREIEPAATLGKTAPEKKALQDLNEYDAYQANPGSFSNYSSAQIMGMLPPSQETHPGALDSLMAEVNKSPASSGGDLQTMLSKLVPPTDQLTTAQSGRMPASVSTKHSSSVRTGSRGATGTETQATALPPATYTSPSDLISKLLGEKGLDDGALKTAQDQADYSRLIGGMEKAGNLIASGFSRGADTAHDEMADDMIKNANVPADQILQRRKALADQTDMGIKLSDLQDKEEMRNPNSALSQRLTQMAINMHVPGIQPGMSGEAIIKAAPIIDTKLKIDALQQRYAEARMNHADSLALRRDALQMHRDNQLDKRFTDLNTHLTAEMSSPRTAFGKAAAVRMAGEKLERMVQGVDRNNINPQQIQELAKALDSMLSMGAATVSGTHDLTPQSYEGDINKLIAKISNKQRGAGMGSFVDAIMDTVEREKALASQQMLATQGKFLGGYADLVQKSPDRWNAMLQNQDLDPDTLAARQKAYQERDSIPSHQAAPSNSVTMHDPQSGKIWHVPHDKVSWYTQQGLVQ
jgi:hypothetical protein